MKCSTIPTLSLLSLLITTNAFTPSILTNPTTALHLFRPAKKSPRPTSPLADEAIQIYKSKYPANTTPAKFFFDGWGMPESYSAPSSDELLFAARDEKLRATFDALVPLYGEENALKMVRIQPGVLAFNPENFGPSLERFGEKFGVEEAKAMVLRNPGLLSVKPANAAGADGLTMQLSYVVEVTRPIGAAGPIGVLALLSVPVIEGALGMTRGELLASLF